MSTQKGKIIWIALIASLAILLSVVAMPLMTLNVSSKELDKGINELSSALNISREKAKNFTSFSMLSIVELLSDTEDKTEELGIDSSSSDVETAGSVYNVLNIIYIVVILAAILFAVLKKPVLSIIFACATFASFGMYAVVCGVVVNKSALFSYSIGYYMYIIAILAVFVLGIILAVLKHKEKVAARMAASPAAPAQPFAAPAQPYGQPVAPAQPVAPTQPTAPTYPYGGPQK